MSQTDLLEKSVPFLNYLENWLAQLPTLTLSEIAPQPARAALLTVDMTEGFCSTGPLASPRVAAIAAPIASLMQTGWQHGMRHFILPQDSHDPQAVEFGAYPPHCVLGSIEAQTIKEISSLPFFDRMLVLPKNSISSSINTGLDEWLAAHPEVDTFIVTGDCTDLCTYQLAMHLRLQANSSQIQRRVIVPANCAATYDRPVEVAQKEGGLPHPGDLLDAVFLYHMALNGVEVARAVI